MRILLINPPICHPTIVPGLNSTWREHDWAPPLGLMAISAYSKKFGHREIRLLNGQTAKGLTDQEAITETLEFKPELVGITTSTFFLYDAIRMARLVKGCLPAARIVLGGPHLTEYAMETVEHPEVDFGVVGEGELPFLELIEALARQGDFSRIPGLAWKAPDGKVHVNPPEPARLSLDDLPVPDYDLIDISGYRIAYDYLHPSGVIVTSRGCPYHCTFCSLNYPYFRTRGAESIVNEMKFLKSLGYRAVTFNDDNFNVSRKRVLQICDLIVEQGLCLPWSFRGRVDCIDEELIQKVAAAGCIRIHFGVESGVQEILDSSKKGITLGETREAFRLCRKYKISTVAFFMFGLPGETQEQAQKTIDFALELNPEYVVFTSLMPQPGSALYTQALQAGAFSDYLREFAKDPVPDLVWRGWYTGMSQEIMDSLMHQALFRFYLRPGYIAHRLATLNGPRDLWVKTVSGLKLIRQLTCTAVSRTR